MNLTLTCFYFSISLVLTAFGCKWMFTCRKLPALRPWIGPGRQTSGEDQSQRRRPGHQRRHQVQHHQLRGRQHVLHICRTGNQGGHHQPQKGKNTWFLLNLQEDRDPEVSQKQLIRFSEPMASPERRKRCKKKKKRNWMTEECHLPIICFH